MTPSAIDHNFADLDSARHALERRYDQFARHVRARLFLEEAAKWIALMVVLLLVTFALDRTLRLSGPARRALLIALVAIAAAQAWRWLLAPFRLKLDSQVLASALERSTGQAIAARTATILQLPVMNPQAVSQPMIASAVARSAQSLAAIDFNNHFDPRRRRLARQAIAATFLVTLTLIFASPSIARLWMARLFAGSNQPWPQRTFLQVAGLGEDRTLLVPRGESFVLRASASDGSVRPETIWIHWRQRGASVVETQFTQFAANDFRYDFPSLQTEATVELSGGDDVLSPFAIRPVERPRIVDLKLISRHPTEKTPKTHNFSGDDAGDLSFLPYTKLELSFTANTPIAAAHLTSSTTQPSGADVRRINDRQFALSWEHFAAAQLQIELTGVEAQLTSAPTGVSIGLKTDKPPRVTLGFSGVRQRITPQATIPLVVEARDDYSIERIDLQTRTEIAESEDSATLKTTATTLPVWGPATRPDDPRETEVRQSISMHVPDLQLQPGHLLTFTASATDNCYPRPQSASSRQVVFRVVRPEELFKEILTRQQSERAKFRKQLQEAQTLRQDLEQKDNPEILASLGRRHRTVQREINRIASALSDSVTEMRLNVLGNSDAYELMEKGVLAPMKALDGELMNPQRDALDALHPGDSTAFAASASREDQIIVRMEEILRQMTQWDSFIDVLNQLNEIIRLENQVQQGTNVLKKKQAEDVFDH